jgi:hypothetical protein
MLDPYLDEGRSRIATYLAPSVCVSFVYGPANVVYSNRQRPSIQTRANQSYDIGRPIPAVSRLFTYHLMFLMISRRQL